MMSIAIDAESRVARSLFAVTNSYILVATTSGTNRLIILGSEWMTRDEAKKKAEESAQHNNAIDYDDERVYELGFMACYDWMVGGEADGYGIEYDGKLRSDSVGEYYFSSGFGNEVMLAFIDRTDAEDYIETLQPTSAKIEIVPVKLITVEGSSK